MAAEYIETGLQWEPLKGEKRVHSGLAVPRVQRIV
jgi:hypothetical protein